MLALCSQHRFFGDLPISRFSETLGSKRMSRAVFCRASGKSGRGAPTRIVDPSREVGRTTRPCRRRWHSGIGSTVETALRAFDAQYPALSCYAAGPETSKAKKPVSNMKIDASKPESLRSTKIIPFGLARQPIGRIRPKETFNVSLTRGRGPRVELHSVSSPETGPAIITI